MSCVFSYQVSRQPKWPDHPVYLLAQSHRVKWQWPHTKGQGETQGVNGSNEETPYRGSSQIQEDGGRQ